jgi:hypothetical protein
MEAGNLISGFFIELLKRYYRGANTLSMNLRVESNNVPIISLL